MRKLLDYSKFTDDEIKILEIPMQRNASVEIRTALFRRKMAIIHPTYDFSKFIYLKDNVKGIYYCPHTEHGPRKAIPNHLLGGSGCAACSKKCKIWAKKQFFINVAKVHPTYNFSEFIHSGAFSKGIYYCDVPEHGPREGTPDNLLKGNKCSACAGQCTIWAKKQFPIKMKKLFPTYDFSQFNYIDSSTKGIYYCDVPEHGPQKAIPNSLLNGSGCGQCNNHGRVQQTKIFTSLKEKFHFLNWLWEKKYSFMENLEFDISARLPNGKILAVEYDGEQHYRPVNFGGRSVELSEAALLVTQALDKRKNELATMNGVVLARISCYEWQADSEATLDKLYKIVESSII